MNMESAKKVFEGEIFTMWQYEQELYDGSTATFEYLTRPDYATVIGVLPNENILLAWDEQPQREGVLTTPGGRVEEGESAEDGAKREFLEETGYSIGELHPLYSRQASGKVMYTDYFFIGRELTKTREPELDPGERVTLHEYSFEDFLRLGRSDSEDLKGPIRDQYLRCVLLEALLDRAKKKELYTKLYE